jgi:hypothetical protein
LATGLPFLVFPVALVDDFFFLIVDVESEVLGEADDSPVFGVDFVERGEVFRDDEVDRSVESFLVDSTVPVSDFDFDERSRETLPFGDEADPSELRFAGVEGFDDRFEVLVAFVGGRLSFAFARDEASSASRAFRASACFFNVAGLGMFIRLSPLIEFMATAFSGH